MRGLFEEAVMADSFEEVAERICLHLHDWERGRISRLVFKQLIVDALLAESRSAKQAQREKELLLIEKELRSRGCCQGGHSCRNFIDPDGDEPHSYHCPIAWADWVQKRIGGD